MSDGYALYSGLKTISIGSAAVISNFKSRLSQHNNPDSNSPLHIANAAAEDLWARAGYAATKEQAAGADSSESESLYWGGLEKGLRQLSIPAAARYRPLEVFFGDCDLVSSVLR